MLPTSLVFFYYSDFSVTKRDRKEEVAPSPPPPPMASALIRSSLLRGARACSAASAGSAATAAAVPVAAPASSVPTQLNRTAAGEVSFAPRRDFSSGGDKSRGAGSSSDGVPGDGNSGGGSSLERPSPPPPSSSSSTPRTAAVNRYAAHRRTQDQWDAGSADLPALEKQVTRRGFGGAYSPGELNWVDQKEEPWRKTSPFLPPPASGLVSRSHRHLCALHGCEDDIHFTNIKLLEYFISDTTGQIKPRRQSGLCAKNHRKVSRTIKQARQLGLIPIIEPYVVVDKTTSFDDIARGGGWSDRDLTTGPR